ncbi:hypothetical protein [Streptomyces sp. NPDC056670]|uniref:hypothetical protein n=1 Tax=Streptomyces sp. NPDC056670 TaxID=3345904 RepID=UPI00367EACDD
MIGDVLHGAMLVLYVVVSAASALLMVLFAWGRVPLRPAALAALAGNAIQMAIQAALIREPVGMMIIGVCATYSAICFIHPGLVSRRR